MDLLGDLLEALLGVDRLSVKDHGKDRDVRRTALDKLADKECSGASSDALQMLNHWRIANGNVLRLEISFAGHSTLGTYLSNILRKLVYKIII